MKLIEALVVAQQEYGIDGHWQTIHFGNALHIKRVIDGFYEAHDGGIGLFSRSDRLETVLADFAERYPYELLDEQWKAAPYTKGAPRLDQGVNH